ncbi:MAG: hypothetical protein QOG80_1869 [Pseudonocardiales bacterium]|nr:hypothetical protein [Pseudonocardiales bacterium]
MSDAVKRTYSSPLRAEQAQVTRRAIVSAAARLFVDRGYGATTVDAIAEAAGVSRKTVFTSVGGKIEALKLARDWAVVGDDRPVPVLDRPQVRRAEQEPDARKILREYVDFFSETCGRGAQLHRVIESSSGVDADVRALAEEGRAQRRVGMSSLAALLAARGALRLDLILDHAVDLLWLYNDPVIYTRLVLDRGWTVARFADWLYETMLAQLIRPGYRPRKS